MINTKRLKLQLFSGTDTETGQMIKNWISDPLVQKEYGEPVYTTKEELRPLMERYKKDPYRWAVYEKESGECIGQIAFCRIWNDVKTAEIEYCIGTGYQGHGYAGEALSAIIEYGLTQAGFAKLEAYHRTENIRSGKVLLKSSMHTTDTVERFRQEGTKPAGEICYCITADEWNPTEHEPVLHSFQTLPDDSAAPDNQ